MRGGLAKGKKDPSVSFINRTPAPQQPCVQQTALGLERAGCLPTPPAAWRPQSGLRTRFKGHWLWQSRPDLCRGGDDPALSELFPPQQNTPPRSLSLTLHNPFVCPSWTPLVSCTSLCPWHLAQCRLCV